MAQRDHRILELWKREKNKVDVETLVNESYRENASKIRNDFSEDAIGHKNMVDDLASNSINSDVNMSKDHNAL